MSVHGGWLTDEALREMPLPLTALQPFHDEIIRDAASLLRSLSRDKSAQCSYHELRREAAKQYHCPEALRREYERLVDVAHEFIQPAPALQSVDGQHVPLVEQEMLVRRSLPRSLRETFAICCAQLELDSTPVFEAWQERVPASSSYVALEGDCWVLCSPETDDYPGLIRLAHEAGHLLYEVGENAAPWESVARYIESEACAMLLCRRVLEATVRTVEASPPENLVVGWERSIHAEDHLNFHFLLDEAALLAMAPQPDPLRYSHLRESAGMFFGYQVIYAAASMACRDAPEVVWDLMTPP